MGSLEVGGCSVSATQTIGWEPTQATGGISRWSLVLCVVSCWLSGDLNNCNSLVQERFVSTIELSVPSLLLADNKIYNMQDAGIAFYESMNGEIYNNDIEDCGMGMRLSVGSAGNYVYNNQFDGCTEGQRRQPKSVVGVRVEKVEDAGWICRATYHSFMTCTRRLARQIILTHPTASQRTLPLPG